MTAPTLPPILSAFLSTLNVRVVDDDTFMLLSDLRYRSAVMGAIIVVPSGFVTDFASVPRMPFAYWMFGGRAKKPAVVHDMLYQTHVCGQKDVADRVFLEAMEVYGLDAFHRDSMYNAVRDLGASAWDSGPARLQILNPDHGLSDGRWKPVEPIR